MIRKTILSISIFMMVVLFSGCGRENSDQSLTAQNDESGYGSAKTEDDIGSVMEQEIMDGTDTGTIVLSSEVMQPENGLSAVGTILAAALADLLVSSVLKLAGNSNFSSAPPVIGILLPAGIVILLFMGFAYLAAGRIRRVNLTVLISEG